MRAAELPRIILTSLTPLDHAMIMELYSLVAAGYSFQEISEAFGVSVATIGRDVCHLREAMGRIL